MGRQTTRTLKDALAKYETGDEPQLETIITQLALLVEFYPQHIDTEDNHFFKPVMSYFTPEEQQSMLDEGQAFDRKMIHRKYLNVVQRFEKVTNLDRKDTSEKWLEFL